MLLEHYRQMARYNRWMNEKLYAVCGSLDDAELARDRGAFFGSIRGTLNHLLLADRVWMSRFTGDPARFASHDASGSKVEVTSLRDVLYPNFEDLKRERERTDAEILAWVTELEDAKLLETLHYETLSGVPQAHPGWWAIGHFFNHQTHHRGQVTTLLMQAGRDPGVTDLLAMIRAEEAAASR
jgi:uncharacterized damage-inducible protein DinB